MTQSNIKRIKYACYSSSISSAAGLGEVLCSPIVAALTPNPILGLIAALFPLIGIIFYARFWKHARGKGHR